MSLIVQLVSNLPYFGIYLVAAIIAVSRWDKHPTTSLLVVTAAGISVLARVGIMMVPIILAGNGVDTGTVMSIIYGITGLVSNIALTCLVAAVFSDRSSKSAPPPTSFR